MKQFRLHAWIESLDKWLFKLLVKAPATSGLLMLRISQTQKCLVANCRRNGDANYGTYQSPRLLRRDCDKRLLCSGTHSKDSQSDSLLFLGKDGIVGFCEVTGAMVNRTTRYGL